MRVTELQKVLELDSQINEMHKKLAELYTERSKIVSTDAGKTVSGSTTASREVKQEVKSWPLTEYDNLKQGWENYGIKIPAYKNLEKRLLNAFDLWNELQATVTFAGKMSVVLVPPTGVLPFPLPQDLRAKQHSVELPDYVSEELPRVPKKRTWELYLVYNQETGFEIKDTNAMVPEEITGMVNFPLYYLNVREYAAFTLMNSSPVDQNTWSMLPSAKDDGTSPVACVSFSGGRYRFDIDDSRGLLGDNRFRPAIHVK